MISLDPGVKAGLLLWITLILFCGFIVYFKFFRSSFGLRWLAGLIISLALLFSGSALVAVWHLHNHISENEYREIRASNRFICRVDSSPLARVGSFTIQATALTRLDSLAGWTSLNRKVLMYLKSDSLCKPPGYGDLIIVAGNVQPVPLPSNPDMFDFKKYLQDLQISLQVFADVGHWKSIGGTKRNPLKAGAETCRKAFLDVLRDFGIDGQEFALAAALLLGSRDFLEKETEIQFSNAGAVHILSVSGLHVGIMYIVADKLLFFLKRGRRSRRVQQVLIICCIWAYAFISGLPSSVIRASMMFSLIAAGNMLKRSPENYNILVVAAFCQLWIDPFEITRVGFQLSYLAVLGIFAFYQPINGLISQVNRPVEWLWSIIAVSLAAQLVTFPLGSYYFHMFPVYFLITNLLVVPLAAIITYFAVFLLVAGASGLTFAWLAWPLQQSLRFMIDSVEFIQSWPGAVIEPIMLSRFQVSLIFVMITALFLLFVHKKKRSVFIFPVCITLIFLSILQHRFTILASNEVIVYNVPGHTAIDLFNKRRTLFICDEGLKSLQKKIDFQIRPHRIKEGINVVIPITLNRELAFTETGTWMNDPFIYFQGKKIVLISNGIIANATQDPPENDLVIVSGNCGQISDDIFKFYRFKMLVADSSVPSYKAELLKDRCNKSGIAFHYVRDDGAFVLKW
jgi:competence protein ComEC